jgi:hypothetical protein
LAKSLAEVVLLVAVNLTLQDDVAEINAPGMKALKVPLQRSSKGNIVDVGMASIFTVQVCSTCFTLGTVCLLLGRLVDIGVS